MRTEKAAAEREQSQLRQPCSRQQPWQEQQQHGQGQEQQQQQQAAAQRMAAFQAGWVVGTSYANDAATASRAHGWFDHGDDAWCDYGDAGWGGGAEWCAMNSWRTLAWRNCGDAGSLAWYGSP